MFGGGLLPEKCLQSSLCATGKCISCIALPFAARLETAQAGKQ